MQKRELFRKFPFLLLKLFYILLRSAISQHIPLVVAAASSRPSQ